MVRKSITSRVIYTVCLDAPAKGTASQVLKATDSPSTVSVQRVFKGGRALRHPSTPLQSQDYNGMTLK